MAAITVPELVKEVGIAEEDLDVKCSQEHLLSVSSFLDWRQAAPYLGLKEREIDDIEVERKTEQEKRRKTLEVWSRKYGFKATYRKLVDALLASGQADDAEKVCRLLVEGPTPKASPTPPPPTPSTSSHRASQKTRGTLSRFFSSLLRRGQHQEHSDSSETIAQKPRPTVPDSPTNTASAPTSPPQESDGEPLGELGLVGCIPSNIYGQRCSEMALSELEKQLISACKSGWLEIVKNLVQTKSVDPSCQDEDGDTPLHLACLNGHIKIVHFLAVDKQCDAESRNNKGDTPLHYASIKGNLSVVKLLVDDIRCSPTIKGQLGRSPLHHACQEGCLQIAKYLIEDVGVDPLCRDDERGTTPLHLASQAGHTNLVMYLAVEKQVDAECRNYHGDTPFHRAARYGQLDVVKLLVDECHCDPMCTGQLERTPLHHACEKGHLNVVKYLTDEQNVDTSHPDTNNVTPLHMAALNGHAEVIKHLVGVKKCDPAPRDVKGETPYDYARKNQRMDIAIYLTQHGGERSHLYSPKPFVVTSLPGNLEDSEDSDDELHYILVCSTPPRPVSSWKRPALPTIPDSPISPLDLRSLKGLIRELSREESEEKHSPLLPPHGSDSPANTASASATISSLDLTSLKDLIRELSREESEEKLPPHGSDSLSPAQKPRPTVPDSPTNTASAPTSYLDGGKPDLADALRVTFPVATAWKNIGVFLKIPSHILGNIEVSQNHVPTDCLREMLSAWLTQIDPPPTWRSLANVMEMINPAVAQKIEQKYLTPLDRSE